MRQGWVIVACVVAIGLLMPTMFIPVWRLVSIPLGGIALMVLIFALLTRVRSPKGMR